MFFILVLSFHVAVFSFLHTLGETPCAFRSHAKPGLQAGGVPKIALKIDEKITYEFCCYFSASVPLFGEFWAPKVIKNELKSGSAAKKEDMRFDR